MKGDEIFCQHVLECIEKVHRYTAGKKEALNDPIVRDASVMRTRMLLEAIQRISDSLKTLWINIHWRELSSHRDYFTNHFLGNEKDVDVIWDIYEKHMPQIKDCIEARYGAYEVK
ncbi:MAG: HepT-like ribonuclease domain-containing protein [Alphaproteobacteria bacterium]